MVNRQAQYGQDSNRIIDATTFLSINQSLKELERLVDSFGRTLTDNERRLQQTLPGMIKTFDRIEKEYNSGNGKLSKSQAADLKVMIANEKNILKWLDELSRFNPKTGLALNDRNDQSFIRYASIFEDVMQKLTDSMQRSYKKWDTYNRDIDKVRQTYGLLPASARTSNIAPASPIPQIPRNRGVVDASNFGYAYIRQMEQEELASRTASMKDPFMEILWKLRNKTKLNIASATQTANTILNRNFNAPQKNAGYGAPPINRTIGATFTGASRYTGFQRGGPALFPPRPTKRLIWERRANFFGDNTGFFQNLHKALGTLPGIGSITGLVSNMSSGGNALRGAGGVLKDKFSSQSLLGKVGKLLAGPIGIAIGATAVAVGVIYKQMKKSSPILQAVSNLFELAWNLLWMPLGNALGTLLLPMAEDMINFAIMFNKIFTDFSLEALRDLFWSMVQLIWGALMDLSSALPNAIVNFLLDKAIDFAEKLGLNGVASVLKDSKDIFNNIYNGIRNIPSIISGLINSIISAISGGFSNLFSGKNFVEGAKDGFKNAWNDSIGALTGVKLATGGVVTSPTFALVGEAGPEAVIPLDKMNGMGSTYVINVNGDVYGVSDLESRIERVIQRTANKAYYR